MPLHIRLESGSRQGSKKSFADDVESIVIGRDPDRCQVVLDADARMAGREHCTIVRIRGRYLIDMAPDRAVYLEDGTLLEPGTPLPDRCRLTIGPDGPQISIRVEIARGLATTKDQGIDQEVLERRESRPASAVELERAEATADEGRKWGLMALAGAACVIVVVIVSLLLFSEDVEQLQVADQDQSERIEDVEIRTTEAEEDLVSLGADLPEILEEANRSLWLVLKQSADGGETAFGTAFVAGPGVLATNAHVAEHFDSLESGETMVLRSASINGEAPTTVEVRSVTLHPGYHAFEQLWGGYMPVRLNASAGMDAVRSAGTACDLALLQVDPSIEIGPVLPLATDDSQAALRAGHVIGMVGFPMEGMAMEGVNLSSPAPQTQIGRVTALTTFFNASEDEGDAPGQRNLLIQHSIPATGGASGSPLLNGRGEVVGVLSAVNFAILDGKRIPTGVGVNFAQRATLLEELIDGSAETMLSERSERWSAGLQRLYYSGVVAKGESGLDELIAMWRHQIESELPQGQALVHQRDRREFFPLDSLNAGRKAAGLAEAKYSTEIDFNVESGVWYLLAASADGDIEIDVVGASEDAAGIGEVVMLQLGNSTGAAFKSTQTGQVRGLVRGPPVGDMEVEVHHGEAVGLRSAALTVARQSWKEDLARTWTVDVRDFGGRMRDGSTSVPDGSLFVSIEPIVTADGGDYLLAAVNDEGASLNLSLWQIVDGERTELGQSTPDLSAVSFTAERDAALEVEISAEDQDTPYKLHLYRAALIGDTNADDEVELNDIVDVIQGFGTSCLEGEACNLDVDDDGVVAVQDVLHVLTNYGQEWPPRTQRYKAWSWGAVTLDRVERLVPFVWGASWTPPRDVVRELASRPKGDRVLFLFANLVNDMAVHEDDRCVEIIDGDEVTTEFKSVWIENGVSRVRGDLDAFFSELQDEGGQLDVLVLDNEKTFSYGHFMDSDRSQFSAIMNDPRFDALVDDLGFDDLTMINWGNEYSRQWDQVMQPEFSSRLIEAVMPSIEQYYPEILVTNYGEALLNEDIPTWDGAGHQKVSYSGDFGTHASSQFYARISAAGSQFRPDGHHPIGQSDFAGLRMTLHWLRSMQASDARSLWPWICNRGWQSSEAWPNTLQDSPYWREQILHMGLTGIDRFLYWTEQNVFQHDPEFNNPTEEQELLVSTLAELEGKVGTLGIPIPVGRHSFGDEVLATGMQKGDQAVWRFTFGPAVGSAIIEFDDGEEIVIAPPDGDVGVWFSHPMARPLKRNSEGVPIIRM